MILHDLLPENLQNIGDFHHEKKAQFQKDAVLPKYPFLHHWKLSLKQPKDYW